MAMASTVAKVNSIFWVVWAEPTAKDARRTRETKGERGEQDFMGRPILIPSERSSRGKKAGKPEKRRPETG
jgi:hypothetical protein